MVTKYRREAQISHCSESTHISIEVKGQPLVNEAMGMDLASVRQIAPKALITRTTVHRQLARPLCMTARHRRWVPHRLSLQQKYNRLQKAQELHAIFKSVICNSRQTIMTVEKCFFYMHRDFEHK
jgi:hypothetical protein